MKHIKKLFENGRTMLEVLAALAILASIGVGISTGINHGLMVYRSSVLQTQLPQLKKAIQTVYAFENYDYSDVENRDDYSELFENILDDNACTGNICKSAGGSFKVSPVNGGRGFKITFIEMPKGICLELADAIRNDRSSTVKQGFIMANSCNTDNKQIVEFVNAESFEDNQCPGRQVWNGTNCTCFNENAIGEECELPTLDPVIPPATTTTTTKAEIYYSSDNGNDKEPEQTEVTATYEILYSSAADALEETTTAQVYKTETETPTYTMAMTTNVETQTPTMATFATETTVETTLPPHTSDMSPATADQITMTSGYNYGDGNDGKTTTNIPATAGGMTTETQTSTTTGGMTTVTETPTTTGGMTTVTETPMTTGGMTTATETPTTTATATHTLETTTPYGMTETPALTMAATVTETPTTTTTATATQTPTTTATATHTPETTTAGATTTATRTATPETTTREPETTTPYGMTETTALTMAATVTETPTTTATATRTPETTTAGATTTATATRTPETTTREPETTTAGATTTATRTATPETTTREPETTVVSNLEQTAQQPVQQIQQLSAIPTNEIVSGEAFIKLTDLTLDGFNANVTCGLYIPDMLSSTVIFDLSITTADGRQPTLSLVKSMDWSGIKEACHNYIESERTQWVRTLAFKGNEDEYYKMIGNVKSVNYAGTYSENPFVYYYLVKANPIE